MDFKKKWSEYEWENKIIVKTSITDLKDYVEFLANTLNVQLLTNIEDNDHKAGFLVANFYTKSKFEEDCLLNVSIEKTVSAEGGKINGLIRVRAKTEGMALCMGEKCKQVK